MKEVAAGTRYTAALPGFLRRRLTEDDCRTIVGDGLALRAERFLQVLEQGIYARENVFRRLLGVAGVELGDAKQLVAEHGVEGALTRLHDAGVFLTLEQFKGLRPIVRDGWTYNAKPEDFDNPLITSSVTRTIGSSGAPRRTIVSFADLEHSAAYTGLFLTAFGLRDRPAVLWRPLPPGQAGLGNILQLAKLGIEIDRWFSQNPLLVPRSATRELPYTLASIVAARRAGIRIPLPVHVSAADALPVARCLAEHASAGRPAHLNTTAGAAVRVCTAAEEHGLDIAGSFLRVGGEPLTRAKRKIYVAAGCRAACHYTTSEIGRIGIACADPAAPDDVHIATDKLALIQREHEVGAGRRVDALCVSTVAPTARRLMLNVETDDYGVLSERSCGCPLGELGLTLHLSTIRSYDKLTSEGMNFLGPVLLRLIEEVLPKRFGGSSTDYQLVEQESDGLAKVSVVVAPRVGEIDETAVIETVLATLGDGPSSAFMMAGVWRDAETVRVLRQVPHETQSGKILPLHLTGSGR